MSQDHRGIGIHVGVAETVDGFVRATPGTHQDFNHQIPGHIR
jgi:hypothetical protein